MSDPEITHISQISHIDIATLDNTSFYETFEKLWHLITTPIYHDPKGKPILDLLDIHQKFLAEMALPTRRENPDELFSRVWDIIKSPFHNNPSEKPILDLVPLHQKFLVEMVARGELENPVAIFSEMLGRIKFFKMVSRSRRPYPLHTALNTFEMLMDATTPQIRRSVWLDQGERISQVHPKLFERLSVQVVKEKLLAQKEVQEGLNQAPAHSKM